MAWCTTRSWGCLFLAMVAASSAGACIGGDSSPAGDGGSADGTTIDVPVGNSPLIVVPAGNGKGQVTSQPAGIDCGAACAASFPNGTSVVLTETPDPGSTFTGWTGGGCTGTGACTVALTAPTTVTATFALTQYALTVIETGTGTVTSNPAGISCGSTCAASFDYGTSVTLTAQPGGGFVFGGWSGGGCSGTGTCVVKMTAATTITAAFPAFATWDPAWSLAGITYSNGNLSMSGNSANTKNARTTIGKSTGKMYWEITATAGSNPSTTNFGGLGIAEAKMPNNVMFVGDGSGASLGFGYYGYSTWWSSWTGVTTPNGNPPASSYVTAGNIYMFALDMGSGNFWVGQNGIWYNGGNPSTGTAPAAIGITGTVYPAVTFYQNSTLAFTANFGQTALQYTVPTGFQAGFY